MLTRCKNETTSYLVPVNTECGQQKCAECNGKNVTAARELTGDRTNHPLSEYHQHYVERHWHKTNYQVSDSESSSNMRVLSQTIGLFFGTRPLPRHLAVLTRNILPDLQQRDSVWRYWLSSFVVLLDWWWWWWLLHYLATSATSTVKRWKPGICCFWSRLLQVDSIRALPLQ